MNQILGLTVATCLVLITVVSTVRCAPSANDELNTLMLKRHNEVRSQLANCQVKGQPPPASMQPLKYDQELADLAQQWANQCKVGHGIPTTSSWGRNVGQNWAGTQSFQKYTVRCGLTPLQIVWADTRAIGCAYKQCGANFPYGKSIVCNYGPA
ncbi:hypothetical protein FBUS_04778 [Fasciolopsis buskii]|uniref:SCP domain-containing protein n=1 Tax=Fasciolopsis buskii TaxID=27845 RepID=A0A8E0VM24_9TREM|nr:hypothetical protein FBUS_04778 [Fasciolopsis buski]